MKNLLRSLTLPLALCVFLAGCGDQEARSNKEVNEANAKLREQNQQVRAGLDELAKEQKDEGFVSLFNGKDLTGWKYGTLNGKDTKKGKGYQVKPDEKVVYCTVDDGGNLFTEKEYADFHLKFEFKLTPSANNGIGIRAPLEGRSAYVGMEIQVIDDGGEAYKKRTLRPEQHHGSIYDVVAAKQGALKPVGEWNQEEIIAKGRHIKVIVNGQTTVDANLDDVKDPEVLKKHTGLQNKTGHIGFLGHGAIVEFRNLRVKELVHP